jgi:Trk K+ transport system NAD-binding subunit
MIPRPGGFRKGTCLTPAPAGGRRIQVTSCNLESARSACGGGRQEEPMDRPIILCGLGRVGWRVLEYLRAGGLPVVVIDTRCAADDPRLSGVPLVRGDCRHREALEEAGVARAGGVLIVTSDDLVNISTALMVRHLNPGVRVVMRMFNQNLLTRLGKAVNNIFALSTSTLVAPVLAMTALTGAGLGVFRIEGLDEGRREVAEVAVGAGSSLPGRALGETAARHEAVVLAHFPAVGEARYLTEVNPAARLEAGDRLVVCGEPRALTTLLGAGGDEAADRVLWSSWVRRLARMAWRTLTEVDLAVKVCGAVLVAVVLVSTLVFFGEMPTLGWAEALYRTTSVIVTGSDQRVGEEEPAPLKVFVSVLRIAGIALTAAFTAIFTNYLLRARLGGALEIRRVPDGGHVIVCGLGNVGFRVVEELVGYGERVVVLEVARDNRFVGTARRLGAAVIHGDGTVREVLRQANAASARAVVAATSNDLVNLEIALLARDLNPDQRVVLRLADPHLAHSLREAANVRLAFSVSALAAPAFVAALFGDRVLNVFLVGDRLLAVVDMLVQSQDAPLIDKPVRALAVDYGLRPVAVFCPDGAPEAQGLAARLQPGSRLVAVISLADLERFVRRQPVPNDCAVHVTAFSLPAREWVALLLRTQQGLTAEDADRALDQLPVCLGKNLTRGQAEDLLELLSRQRVTGQLRQAAEI